MESATIAPQQPPARRIDTRGISDLRMSAISLRPAPRASA
jgi:hypothetical protein